MEPPVRGPASSSDESRRAPASVEGAGPLLGENYLRTADRTTVVVVVVVVVVENALRMG
jgi:hypothetical protein